MIPGDGGASTTRWICVLAPAIGACALAYACGGPAFEAASASDGDATTATDTGNDAGSDAGNDAEPPDGGGDSAPGADGAPLDGGVEGGVPCDLANPCSGGCCDLVTKLCVAGGAPDACGSDGGACVSCTSDPSGRACVAGVCGCTSEADCLAASGGNPGRACDRRACSAVCDTSHPCNGGCCDLGAGVGQCAAGDSTDSCGSGGNCSACDCAAGGPACVHGGNTPGMHCGCDPVDLSSCTTCAPATTCSPSSWTCQ